MNKAILKGLCQCGCGRQTNLAQQTSKRFGWIKDEPMRYIIGHQNVGKRGHHWKEGKTKNGGYVLIHNPTHPQASFHGYVREHIRMRALKACGHANWLKCPYCKQWDEPAKMYIQPNTNQGRHQSCSNLYRQNKGHNKI